MRVSVIFAVAVAQDCPAETAKAGDSLLQLRGFKTGSLKEGVAASAHTQGHEGYGVDGEESIPPGAYDSATDYGYGTDGGYATTATTTTTAARAAGDYGGYEGGDYAGEGIPPAGDYGGYEPGPDYGAGHEDPHMACEVGPCAQCHECHGAVDDMLHECDLICDATEYQQCVEHADSVRLDCDFTCEECHMCHHNAEAATEAGDQTAWPCEREQSVLDECLVPAYGCMDTAHEDPACAAAEQCYTAAWEPCMEATGNWTECEATAEQCHKEDGWKCEQAYRSCDTLYLPCEEQYMDLLYCNSDDGCFAAAGGPCMEAEMCFIESFKTAAGCWSNATSFEESRECDKAFGSCDGKGCECSNCYVEMEGGVPHDCSHGNESKRADNATMLRRKAEGGMSRLRSFARWSVRGPHGMAAGKRLTPAQLKQRALSRKASAMKGKPSATWFAKSAKVVQKGAVAQPGDATNATDPHMRCEEGPCLQCNECYETIEAKYWSCEEEVDHEAYWQCIEEADKMWGDCDFKCEECNECHYQAEEEMRAVNDPCHEGCSACDSCLEPVWQCHDAAWQSDTCSAANQCYENIWNEVCASAQTNEDWEACDAAYAECDAQGYTCHKEYLQCDMQGFACQDQCTSCYQCHAGEGCQSSPPCMDADMCYLHSWMTATECQLAANTWAEAEPCYESYNACHVEACECENCYAAEYGWEPMPCQGGEDPCGAKLIRARGGVKAHRGRGYQAWKLRRRHGPASKREIAKRFADGKLRKRSH